MKKNDVSKAVEKRYRLFAEYYVATNCLNATQAAIDAGYSKKTARQIASRLLTIVNVQIYIREAMAARVERLNITQDAVLLDWWAIAKADANELIEYRVTCCRYCWGNDYLYQYTPSEYRDLVKQIDGSNKRSEGKEPYVEPPDISRASFDARKPPNPDCPECFGDGEGREVIKDTRNLSPSARLLYQGIAKTKDGFKVLMASQEQARENAGRHIGMLKQKVEITGKDGAPVEQKVTVIDENQVKAALDKLEEEY